MKILGLLFIVFTMFLLSTASLMFDLPLVQLLPGVMIVVTAVGIFFLYYPVLPLYIMVFLSLLPVGLIPYTIYSPLYFMILLWALGSFLFEMALQRRPFVWTYPFMLLVVFLIWNVVTLTWTSDLVIARQELVQYTFVVTMLFLLINQIDSLNTLDGLMCTLAINGWILVLAGISTLWLTDYELGTRLKILDTNENSFGIILMVTLPGVFWGVLRSPPRQKALRMLLSFIFISFCFIFVALSGSRGTLGSLLILMAAFWLWKPTRPWGVYSLLLLALALMATPFIFSTLQNRLSDPDEGKFGSRLELWQAGTLLILDYPLGGVGIGNGRYAMVPYMNSIGQNMGGRQEFPAHNPILEVGTDAGLPGILLYLGALVSAVWIFIRRFLYFNSIGAYVHCAYCSLITCLSMGYFFSWIKAGGIKNHSTYFLVLALLIISTRLRPNDSDSIGAS